MDKDKTNFLKGMSILAVIGLHTINIIFADVPVESVPWKVFLLLDQLFRFCVPFFVALSGYALAVRYKEALNLSEYIKRRLFRLLPLYLLWTVIYLVAANFIPGQAQYINSFKWWEIIFLGRGQYHLYFVPMIIQLYLLFPLLIGIVRKWPKISLTAAIVFQILFYQYTTAAKWTDQVQYISGLTWIFYFIFGIYLVYRPIVKWHLTALVVGLIGLFLTLQLAGKNWVDTRDIIWATRFSKLPIILYSTGLLLFISTRKISNSAISYLGKQSYLIYLSHVLLLHLVFINPKSPSLVIPCFLFVVGLFVSLKIKFFNS